MISKDLYYQIALRQTELVGDVTAKSLLQHFGTAQAALEADRLDLLQVQNVGEETAQKILQRPAFAVADRELKFIENNQIQPILYTDKAYPTRLRPYDDAPFLLFYKGNNATTFNAPRVVAVIGTRKPTEQGRIICEKLIEDLVEYNPLVISGLAYGIDITAHRKCLDVGLPTVGIVAHGQDRIYPFVHLKTAEQMQQMGGILTEFVTQTEPTRENFPMRNRIIAGMVDAVIVVETARSGGSIITAELANEYQKDVFAIPGRIDDEFSQGCNWLIKTHKASLIETADDIAYVLRWDKVQNKSVQTQLFADISDEERLVVDAMLGQERVHLDSLIKTSAISTSRIAAILLELEFKGLVKALPGKYFRLI